MKTLIIAEKPKLAVSVVKAIGNMEKYDGYFENDKYIVSFAIGHLLILKDVDDYLKRGKSPWKLEELPFIPERFEFKIADDPGLRKQFKIVKELLNRKDIDVVVNCGDPDKEGEVIISNLIKASGCNKSNIKRLWLPTTTPEFIRNALKNMHDAEKYKNLYNEGLARTYMDWELGINLTRLISIKKNIFLPVGRVLNPIVKFIYDRDMKILNFVKEKYYVVSSECEKDNIKFKLEIKDPIFKIDERSKGEELISRLDDKKAIVKSIKNKDMKKQPSKLFSLSKAQSYISKHYGIQFSDTLKIIQTLYEKGFITYPRTDSQYLTCDEKGFAKKIIDSLKTQGYPVEFNDKDTIFYIPESEDEASSHSALTPTEVIPKLEELNENEKIVYEVIRNRFITNFLIKDTVVSVTEINISIDEFDFKLKGEVIKEKGMYEYEPIKEKDTLLPSFTEGESIDVKFILVQKETTPPKHITDEALTNYLEYPYRTKDTTEKEELKALIEGLKIGTQATRTQIIENAKKYGYIKEKKGIFTIEEKGIMLIETLDLLNIDLYEDRTIEFEKILKKVYKSEITVNDSIKMVEEEIIKIVERAKEFKISTCSEKRESIEREIIGKCPRCHRNIYEGDKKFYCEGYNHTPNCEFAIWKNDKFFVDKGKKVTKSIAKSLLKNGFANVKEFKKKDGSSTYDAKVEIIDTGKYVNFKLKFDK